MPIGGLDEASKQYVAQINVGTETIVSQMIVQIVSSVVLKEHVAIKEVSNVGPGVAQKEIVKILQSSVEDACFVLALRNRLVRFQRSKM